MRHTIFYIPGLGDQYDTFRFKALRWWRIFGVDARLLPMRWDNDEPYEVKFARITNAINQASAENSRITLIGESAGGSMAINAFAAHLNVDRLITIAGVNAIDTPVATYRLRRSPAFAESRQRVDESLRHIALDRMRLIHTVRAQSDHVVSDRYSQIAGACNHRLWTAGHFFTISVCLTLLSGYIIHLANHD